MNSLRMRAARAYLRETPLSVKEIARTVGFQDQLYFSRQYRAYWKKAPTMERFRQ